MEIETLDPFPEQAEQLRAEAARLGVPLDQLLAEDEADLAAARDALAEVEVEGTIPWEQVKAELGL